MQSLIRTGLFYWPQIAMTMLWRSGRIVLVLCVMVMVSVAAMVYLSAMSVGVNDAMIRNSVSLYSGHISGFALLADTSPRLSDESDIRAILERNEILGIMQSGQHISTLRLVAVDCAQEQEFTALARKIEMGQYPLPGEASVLLGRSTAQTLGVTVEQQVLFRTGMDAPPVSLTVSGIFHTGFAKFDQELAFCPQGIFDVEGKQKSFAIYLKDGADAVRIADKLNSRITPPDAFYPWQKIMPDLHELIELNYISMSVVLGLVFGVVSLGMSCAYVVFILKNMREFAIMLTMGVTQFEAMLLVLIQVCALSVFASILGLVLGVVISVATATTGLDLSAFTSHNQYFSVSAVIRPRLTEFSTLAPPSLAVFAGALAAVCPHA